MFVCADGYGRLGQIQQLKLAITAPITDGHGGYDDEGPRPDPQYKFGVTTPYTTAGPGAAVFEEDHLTSAVDPYPGLRGQQFQPRRKDSAVSGGGSEGEASNTNGSRYPPPNSQPLKMKRDQTMRPTTMDSIASNTTFVTDRTLIQQNDIGDGGKVISNSPNGASPNVAEARMRRLLHELDSIGLTDDMTIGRPSVDLDDWAASSSMDHSTGPPPPAMTGHGQLPPSMGPPRQEEIERMQQFAQSRNWPPIALPPNRPPYNQMQRPARYPDAPESASPLSEADDALFFGGGSPMSTNSAHGPRNSRQGSFSQPPGHSMQPTPPGAYRPVQATPINSAAFPMPPRGPPPVSMRTPRRPGTAGEPPVAYYNNNTHASLQRNRFASDQNLRERYQGGLPAASSTSIASGSQGSQIGLSPISPAPAMTLSSSGSRTDSMGSGALETPVEEATPTAPSSAQGAQAAQSPTPTLNATQEKKPVEQSVEKSAEKSVEKPSSPAQEIVITTTTPAEDKEKAKEKAIGTTTFSSLGADSSNSSGLRRGSLDAAMALKPSLSTEISREKGTKSPITELTHNPAINHNPFLTGGFGGGLSFGGVSFAVKDRDPPPYRVHSPPSSSGPINGRSNSLRAGSVGGRSDGSGSSFGDGAHNSRSDHSSTKRTTPAVALATAFVKEGVAGLNNVSTGPVLSKAEKAAEKARLKAEKAAEKAEEARRKVEEEKQAKLNAEEIKRRKKEEKIMKRLQAGEVGIYGGLSGMVSFNT